MPRFIVLGYFDRLSFFSAMVFDHTQNRQHGNTTHSADVHNRLAFRTVAHEHNNN
jgi:hypothetical protein